MNKTLTLFFSLLIFMHSQSFAETITLRADEWCPYTCAAGADKPGFMIEIAQAIFEPRGIKVDYQTMNWARAVSETNKGRFNAVVGAYTGDVPGFILPKVPQGMSVNYFWTKADSNFTYRGIDSVKGKKIGVVNGYSYGGKELDEPIARKNSSFVIVTGDDALLKLIKMTDVNRLDAFVENPYVLNYALSTKYPTFKDKFKPVSKSVVSAPEVYIAFSPARADSKKYVRILSEGMKLIRNSGKLQSILQKYKVKDWK